MTDDIQMETSATYQGDNEYSSLPLKAVSTENNDKFYLQSQRYFLTYAQANFTKEEYLKWFNDKESKFQPYQQIEIAYEEHKNGDKHRHVLINFGRRFQTTSARRFDFKEFHPNIKKVDPKPKDWATCLAYISKYDKSLIALKEQAKYNLGIITSESLAHAIIDSPLSAQNTKVIWEANNNGVNFIVDDIPEPDCAWYTKFKEYRDGLIEDYNPRRDILWFYDPHGNSHKTHFANWAMQAHPEDYAVIGEIDTAQNFCLTISDFVFNKRWTSKYLVITIPRGWIDKESGALYRCLERAKDGIITSTKYQSKSFQIRQDVLIVVLANCMPNIEKLTYDKWHIYHISKNKTVAKVTTVRVKTTGASTMLEPPLSD